MIAAIVAVVAPVSAQPAATIAFEAGVSHGIDRRLQGCDECTPLAREFGGEVALFVTDSLAVLAGVGLGFFGIDVSADDIGLELDFRQLGTLLDRYGGVNCTHGLPVTRAQPVFCAYPRLAYGNMKTGTVLNVSSGLRYYGTPGRARFFAEVEVGVSRLSSTVELLQLRESVSVGWRHITPGVGVDIAVNDRTAVRVSGGWDIGRIEGETLHSAGVGAGLVFNVGRR